MSAACLAMTILAAVPVSITPGRPFQQRMALSILPPRTYLTAPALLLDLAQHSTATSADQQAGADSCTTLRRTTFGADGDRVGTVTVVRVLHPDGSGLLLEHSRFGTSTSGGGWTRTVFTAGQLLAGIAEPLPDDPRALAAAVTEATAGSGSSAAMQAAVVADLASLRVLDAPQRRAVLRLLATLPSSTILGQGGAGLGEPMIGARFGDGTPVSIDLWFTTTGRLAVITHTDTRNGVPRIRTDVLHSARCDPDNGLPRLQRFPDGSGETWAVRLPRMIGPQ
ncbi:hypothetical protein AB0M46_00220 [Dactylosporangium sp. NPDC051485]|uniref:hypothetical protein n=1 Tax=Dactylosporangium sp. NPDC051485 TaxID=3154846 RepID=UPI00343D24A5